ELFVEQICQIQASHLDNAAGDFRALDANFRDSALLLLIGEGKGESSHNGVARLFAAYLHCDGTKLGVTHSVPGRRVNVYRNGAFAGPEGDVGSRHMAGFAMGQLVGIFATFPVQAASQPTRPPESLGSVYRSMAIRRLGKLQLDSGNALKVGVHGGWVEERSDHFAPG